MNQFFRNLGKIKQNNDGSKLKYFILYSIYSGKISRVYEIMILVDKLH